MDRHSSTVPLDAIPAGRQAVADRTPIVVVLAADENFALPLSVTLSSLTRHYRSTRRLRIVVLDAGLAPETKRRLERIAEGASVRATIEWRCPDTAAIDTIDRELESRYTVSMYYRLLIPQLLPESRKAIYLDSDVVLHDDIARLWEEPFDGRPALAAQERTVSCPVAGVAEWQTLGLDPNAPFVNTGVMVMDLEQWRDQGIHWQAIDYLTDSSNRFVRVGDQEALNAVLCGNWALLDPRWNALFYFPDAVHEEAHLSHFAGAHPWRADWRHPAASTFVDEMRKSKWFTRKAYLLWKLQLYAQTVLVKMKELTRPLRHRFGIRKRLPA